MASVSWGRAEETAVRVSWVVGWEGEEEWVEMVWRRVRKRGEVRREEEEDEDEDKDEDDDVDVTATFVTVAPSPSPLSASGPSPTWSPPWSSSPSESARSSRSSRKSAWRWDMRSGAGVWCGEWFRGGLE